MLDRKEPFKKFRVSNEIVDDVLVMKRREGDQAPLNNYVETLLVRITEKGGVLARIEKKQDLILEMLARLLPEAAALQERVLVRGHRPTKGSDEQRKAG